MRQTLRHIRQGYFKQKLRFDIGLSFLGLVNFSLLAITASDKIMPAIGLQKTRYFVLLLLLAAFVGMWLLGYIMDRWVKAVQQTDALHGERSPTWKKNFDMLNTINDRLAKIEGRLNAKDVDDMPDKK